MSGGKWISDLTATTLAADAARHVLAIRLGVVRDALPRALDEAVSDIEPVHQLRVSTRRATAALRLFAPCLPRKVRRAARRTLRAIRRAAGEARDWDVFLAALAAWRPKQPAARQPGVDLLHGYAMAQRQEAQLHLVKVAAEDSQAFEQLIAETVGAVGQPDDHKLRHLMDLADPVFSELLRDLDSAAAADLTDYVRLHQVRIAGKRLRYAMEVFGDCFAAEFKSRIYPSVEAMQDILGRANDSHVAIGRLESLRDWQRTAWPAEWKRYRGGVEAFLRYHKQRLSAERKQFRAWWKRWKNAGTQAALIELVC